MKSFFVFVTLLLALLADVLIGNIGFPVSITLGALIYFAGRMCNKYVAAVLAIAAGIFLDMAYSRSEAFSAVVMTAAFFSGVVLFPSRDNRDKLFLVMPAGGISAAVLVLGNCVSVYFWGGVGYPAGIFFWLLSAVLLGTLGFPVLVVLLDVLAGKLRLPICMESDSGSRLIDRIRKHQRNGEKGADRS